MRIVNTSIASTMVTGVNHVNQSTNLKNPAANTNARVLCPVLRRVLQGPHHRTKSKSMTTRLAEGAILTGLGGNPNKTVLRVLRVLRIHITI